MTPRIIYLCPADDVPTGGIKVIYRHAEMLSALGAEAFVLHPFDTSFRCTWFTHHARFLDSLTLDPLTDFVVIPELWAGIFGPQCLQQNVHYGVFVQNGYLSHPVLPQLSPALLDAVYRGTDLVLAISDDTALLVQLNYPGLDPTRVVRARYSVNERFLSTGPAMPATNRGQAITYMPRKMGTHAARVVFALGQHLPHGWQIIPIEHVDEATCATMLFSSSIFLAFSDFEGLPLPPLEAALAGNLVIGYTGQGALEYWDAPNFQEIHQGDIRGFVTAAAHAAREIDALRLTRADLAPGIDRLAERFSPAAEAANLRLLHDRIERCFAGAQAGALVAELV
jgi:hypothetical protein